MRFYIILILTTLLLSACRKQPSCEITATGSLKILNLTGSDAIVYLDGIQRGKILGYGSLEIENLPSDSYVFHAEQLDPPHLSWNNIISIQVCQQKGISLN